ncbi:energy transducer TonB [Solidesulfovibrio alcoholivorans]|uniref:energy transducer TonB n=1 Tax=Solidesulfovibrio alcoholivorans TaxID=81406 RepID=UPI000694B963|nr:energy transducer TonB [Solidesulfovibrio alcoholivorans]
MTGGVSGQGGGTGGGSGGGEGPAAGAGRGMGEDGGMSLAAVDVKPRIMRQVEPAYPADARRHGIEGRVVARLLVTADGGVNRISIVSAKPPQIFEQAVISALEKWRFHPARYKGREVATWVMLPIRFDLKD